MIKYVTIMYKCKYNLFTVFILWIMKKYTDIET